MELPQDTLYDILIYFSIDDIIKLNKRIKNLQVLQDHLFWIKKIMHDFHTEILVNTDNYTFSDWIRLYRIYDRVKKQITLIKHISHYQMILKDVEFNHIIQYLPENIATDKLTSNANVNANVNILYKWVSNQYKITIWGPSNIGINVKITPESLFTLLFYIYYFYPKIR